MSKVWVGMVASVGLLAACEPTCLSTCQRYYQAEQCDAPPGALTLEDALQDCSRVCERALNTPGPAPEAGDLRFTGTRASPPTSSPQIVNDQEAAAWMDCVWAIPDDVCHEKLEKQYCVAVY